jgi:CRISPR-associated protein Cas1
LLLHNVQAVAQTVGLDPYIGLVHRTVYSRPALPLDLMEEFRPVVVDSVVLRLVNTRQVREQHFMASPNGDGVYLGDEGKRAFLVAYAERLGTRVTYPHTGEQATCRRCIELQARQLARFLLQSQTDYQPFVVK